MDAVAALGAMAAAGLGLMGAILYFNKKDKKDAKQDRDIDAAQCKAFSEKTNTLDLHGYTVIEAKEMLLRFLKTASRTGMPSVLVITGQGLHSPSGTPAIKKMVEGVLKERGYRYSWAAHGGSVIVYL